MLLLVGRCYNFRFKAYKHMYGVKMRFLAYKDVQSRKNFYYLFSSPCHQNYIWYADFSVLRAAFLNDLLEPQKARLKRFFIETS